MRLRASPMVATVVLLCAACVTDPYDGQVIAQHSTTTIPRIAGYTTETGSVKIYAKNASAAWEHVATATVDTSMSYPWVGLTWYPWGINAVTLPERFWRGDDNAGRSATLKAGTVAVGDYVSLSKPWGTCFNPNQTVQQFLTQCQSSSSPELKVVTCGALACNPP